MSDSNEEIALTRMKLSCMEYLASKGWEYESFDDWIRYKADDGVNYRLTFSMFTDTRYVASVVAGWLIEKGPASEKQKQAASRAANSMNDRFTIGRIVYDADDPDDDIFFRYELPGLFDNPQDFLKVIEDGMIILDKLSDEGPQMYKACLEQAE